jgi:Secretion system C-terminal sorting domain
MAVPIRVRGQMRAIGQGMLYLLSMTMCKLLREPGKPSNNNYKLMNFYYNASLSAKTLVLCLCLSSPFVSVAQNLFSQDFSSSTMVSSYIGSVSDQFDFIGVTGSGSSSVYINANGLNLQRNSNNLGFARTTDLASTPPGVLKVSFTLSAPFGTAMASGTAAVFYVGSDFTAAATTTGEGSRHSSLGMTIAGSNMFYLRELNGFTNSTTYTGQQDICWYINNSGASINYTNPSGGATALANDVADVWVGTTRIFAAIPAVTPTQNLTDFKCLFNNSNGNSAIAVDNIEISAGNSVLPVVLSNFTVRKRGTANELTWVTEAEVNNKGYEVQRRSDNGTWESLGFVSGRNAASTYTFTDNNPLRINYYRLRAVDTDDKATLSKIISVQQDIRGHLTAAPNPTSNTLNIQLNTDEEIDSDTKVTLLDITGRQVLNQNMTAETTQLDLSNFVKGTYILMVQSNHTMYQEKIILQ